MDLSNKLNLKTKPVLKIAGIVILALIILVFINSFIARPVSNFLTNNFSHYNSGYNNYYESDMGILKNQMEAGDGDIATMEAPSLSARNIASGGGDKNYGPAGDEAEQYESTDYGISFETRRAKETCSSIMDLKARQEVIFESATEYGKGCNYTFKVKRERANDILDFLKAMNPKQITANTYTIEQQVDDFTSEIAILQNRLASVDDTLNKAVLAYDEVSALATDEKDIDSLAKIINNKVNIIKQLTQDRLDINNRLDQIQRMKIQQLDRVSYTYFYVSVFDNNFFDWQNIKDSWAGAFRTFIVDINKTFQNLSINFVAFIFAIFQYILYILVIIFSTKYVWKAAKEIWRK